MPIDKKYIRYYSVSGYQESAPFRIPPCAGRVTLELFGRASYGQCAIPLSGGGVGTTATQCSKSLVSSLYRGRWYGKTEVTSANITDSSAFAIACQSTYSWFRIAQSTYGAGGVILPQGSSNYCNMATRVGDVIYKGGNHGRRYVTCSGTIICGKSYVTATGNIWGGWGGDAGPRGPGGCGASAYTTGSYQISTTYYPGAGGGANGGGNASTSTAGRSVWNTPSSFGAGGSGGSTTVFYSGTYCNAASVSLGGNGGGKTFVAGCSIAGSANIPSGFCTVWGILTAYLGTKSPPSATYRYVATTPGVYQIVVPIGTTQIQVYALGGGASGNIGTSTSAPGFNSQTGTKAGGGGGGFAYSSRTINYTEPGSVICIQVACSRSAYSTTNYKSSKVTIDGVLEAEAYTAYDVRGGGYFSNSGAGWNANYARNGFTYIGGWGGGGYCTTRSGGGGGAAWYGGFGGTGGSALSTRVTGGGGGAASCSASGSNGTTNSTTTAGGIGGASGTGYPHYGGTPGNGAYNNSTIFLNGRYGAGGGGGSTTISTTRSKAGGAGGWSSFLGAASMNAFCGYRPIEPNYYSYNSPCIPYGPGGGGGGGYCTACGGPGGLFGGGGGGAQGGAGIGRVGLVIIIISVNMGSSGAIAKFTTSTSHVQVI
jgi:hypothetical protein